MNSIKETIKKLVTKHFNNFVNIENNLIQNIIVYNPHQSEFRKRLSLILTLRLIVIAFLMPNHGLITYLKTCSKLIFPPLYLNHPLSLAQWRRNNSQLIL